MYNKDRTIEGANAMAPGFIKMMGGRVVDLNPDDDVCVFEFEIGKEFCHSIDIVQGGFITAMLDAAMSHAVFVNDGEVKNVSSLEISTSYLAPTRAGKLRVEGKALKKSYKTAFLEGRIFNEKDELTATATSVAKLTRDASSAKSEKETP